MPYSIRLEDGVLRGEFSGVLTNADLAGIARDVEPFERAPVVPHRVVDLTPVTRIEIDFPGVQAAVERRLRLRFANSFKTAIVVVNLVQYGFSRMFQTLNDHPQITISIFPTVPDALAWLRAPGLTLPVREWTPPPQWR